MSQHTKEPWFVDREDEELFVVKDRNGEVCEMYFDGNAEANADRIVACVNACEGINPAAVKMMIPLLLKTIGYLDSRAGDRSHNELWAELTCAVARALDGVE